MHELAVTEHLLALTLKHAEAHNASRVTDLYIVVGEMASIVDDSVQFYWDFLSRGTLAEGARLHFKRIPARMTCQDCGHTFSPSEALPCPRCNSVRLQLTQGNEFYLESLEADTP
ncbi:MAG: hydrogenase maturation nickel metallochaperone HypA [Anaerolineae bacterium]|nr:MAG: hydrogenase maturation nickel metallochaperone HypA [Anaerolineae bacterium]